MYACHNVFKFNLEQGNLRYGDIVINAIIHRNDNRERLHVTYNVATLENAYER